ncbi:phosphatidate cytidylyltransferase [Mycolicibacterium fortuitum]|uniref:Phosphatidate cytidylyltransferase n=3 Tax=Mycolicibacterium fortuitum TaxID=1766 RepID=A0A0N7H8I3_MYCFO|nr:phosphatidate cytidylyltransferase [Mycolicibacterium fortuitum]AIY46173.1 Phosphatidate cytidylyltransferase [Mycobacterium sp. VKM Ac-1817D]CRL81728.1 CDP-diglyceride synthetase [Mycolicibacter nonchromogenicus]ALI26303.1 Phosphatidate cytidylyltransferase [Mycolicibacterium fortuitum]AMD54628.1 phosphatidate cytidylyltransferase [Mycolicibacterium fortuitum subsp. fortuitum DSM 46621 = ATCC 6841 = JCM 6387]EJZ10925.1 CDP-diglyceride synthetase [Mycolicibacterium fortuitum subsp. fortuitu
MAQTEPPQKTSRAGRDLPAAITVGVVLGALAIGTLLFAPIWWLPLLAVAIAIATHEVIRRMREHGYALPTVPLLLGGQAMIWLTWPFGVAGLLGAYGGTIVVCMVWRLIGQGLDQQPVNYLRDIAVTVLLATWVPLFAAFTALLIFADHGGARVFTVIVTVVFADIGGYVAGVLFGKHLLAPAISPKKSWEGLGGSLLFGIAAAVLSVAFLLDKPAWVGLPLGLLLVITGVLGDLVESQVKRDLGIKDMGTLLPGHGGIMDRIDAMLPSAVVGWIVLTLLA